MDSPELDNTLAIVGLSGRFPEANDVAQFWENLCAGKDSIAEVGGGDGLVPARGVVENIDHFDAQFFDIGPGEAETIDPQQRLFLECSWEAVESAGYNPDTFEGRIGVYGGSGANTYLINNLLPNMETAQEKGDYLLAVGNRADFLTTRVSYKMNLRGPSLSVQTACSSSLVAVCLACNDLLTYQADMAIAGGMSIIVPQMEGYKYQEGMIYSPDGKCKPFDADANGTVASNGGGVVLLKRLEDAIKDNDTIYATIKGYAVNNDGKEKVGYSAPSVSGQVDVIRSSLELANFDPESIQYVEAHGTGTVLGDPIEVAALSEAFNGKGNTLIGSLKGNIGHLLESAGIAGLIKCAMMLYHHKIPPSIHFDTPNPHIDFDHTPFTVNTQLQDWKKKGGPRRSTVSSFGIGGTNAHVALEEWPQIKPVQKGGKPLLFTLSARSSAALRQMEERLASHLEKHCDLALEDVAYTLSEGRKTFEYTAHFVASTLQELIEKLKRHQTCEKGTLKPPQQGKRVSLPTYPFERQKFWIDPPQEAKKLVKKEVSFTSEKEVFKRLVLTFVDILGVDHVSDKDDFFELGGDSLDITRLSAMIENDFALNVPMQVLMEHTQINLLSTYLFGQLNREEKAHAEGMVTLKKGSKEKTLIFLHPIEGQVFCYRELAKLLKFDGTVYGIYASDQVAGESVETLAMRYIDMVQERGEGSISLAGMSFGGLLAYEMARQMSLKGTDVHSLFLMDTFRPDTNNMEYDSEDDMVVALIELFERKALPSHFLERTTFEERKKRLVASLNMGELSQKEEAITYSKMVNLTECATLYVPLPYNGEILFLEASERFIREVDHSLADDWKSVARGGYEVQKVKGNHQSFLHQPHVKHVAKLLNEHLAKDRALVSK